jgi:germination protein M
MRNKPVIFGILSFVIAFAMVVFLMKRTPVEPPKTENSSESISPVVTGNTQTVSQRKINVKLLFTTPGSKYLTSEERSIVYQETLLAQAKEVLEELLNGPADQLAPTIPPGTKLVDLFISKDGIAYADFSPELVSNHPGGSDGEISTVYSIVDTLTLNFPQIKRVQILVDSKAVETLKGHLDLSRPLTQDSTFVVTKGQKPADDQGIVEKQKS